MTVKLSKKGSKKGSNEGKSKAGENKAIERETVRVFVAVTIHHRAEFSLLPNRIRLGREAYHWGILLMPEAPNNHRCAAFDVSNGSTPDPNTRVDSNPYHDWVFRRKNTVNPKSSGSLVGRVIFGEMDGKTSVTEVGTLLQSLPLPAKHTHPPGSCVTWTLNAVSALQSAGLAYAFMSKNSPNGRFHTQMFVWIISVPTSAITQMLSLREEADVLLYTSEDTP
ncbi:MAG: hypothetical protein SEPTF4163_005771 [Sporothrix epigloea]